MILVGPWLAAPSGLMTLRDCTVHVWTADLRSIRFQNTTKLLSVLSEDERGRCRRCLREDDRNRFARSRFFLRDTLSRYTGIPPQHVQFELAEKGKPFLTSPSWLSFNLSHTADVAVIALTRQARIGVDVENLRRTIFNMDRISRRYLTEAEQASLRSADRAAQTEVFLRAWTRKEAFIKATGEGLTRSLTSFEVSIEDDSRGSLRSLDGCARKGRLWTMIPFHPCDGAIGAVAVEREAVESVEWWRWSQDEDTATCIS